MKDRIAQILQKENMTAIQFAKKVGINPSSLSHILSGRNKASLEIVMKIHKSCTYVNLNWLLYGEGNMIEDESTPKDENGEIIAFSAPENSVNAYNDTEKREYAKENEPNGTSQPAKYIEKEVVKYIERPQRKITEIRIFFDNGTYETFKSDN